MTIKSQREIELMHEAGRIVEEALGLLGSLIRPGAVTKTLDREVEAFVKGRGAIASFKGYRGYPASVCVSINEAIVHGIPDKRVIKEGDIVSVDFGAIWQGYHADAARTFAAGAISDEDARLIEITEQCFFEGIAKAREGNRLSDISNAVQTHAERNGYSVVRILVGHGIGQSMHEPPDVPNFGRPGRGVRLVKGMTIAVEPMINAGAYDAKTLEDGWTVVTADGRKSAHYENTIVVTDGDPLILTLGNSGVRP